MWLIYGISSLYSVTLSFSCHCIVLCLSLCLFPVSALYSVCHFVFFLSAHCTLSVTVFFLSAHCILSVTLSFSCQRALTSVIMWGRNLMPCCCNSSFSNLSFYFLCRLSNQITGKKLGWGWGWGGGRQRGNKAMFSYPLLVTVFVATCFQAAKSIPKLF